jgi:signal transduction histidine kinase
LTPPTACPPWSATGPISPLPTLPPAAEAALCYVASEALTNAAKHTLAASATLTLVSADDGARIRVVDDGVGGADPAGSGLQGLAGVGALGGTFAVASAAASGTVVEAWVPCGSSRQTTPC